MTFTQLNYFITIAKYLNFSRAAQSLFVTQSTLSRSIASMESELGVTLFDRRYHNIKLTPAGELMYRDGQIIMDNMNDLIRRIQAIDEARKSRLSIGVLDGQKIAPRVIMAVKSVMEQVPEFGIDVRRIDYDTAMQDLRDAKLDLVQTLGSPETLPDEGLERLFMDSESYYLVARNDDPIWKHDELSLSVFDGRVVLVPRSYPGNDSTIQVFSDAGVFPRFQSVPDMETLSLWIESGMGVSICNASHVICSAGVKRPVRVEPLTTLPQVPMLLLWNRENITPLLELMLSYMWSTRQSVTDIPDGWRHPERQHNKR